MTSTQTRVLFLGRELRLVGITSYAWDRLPAELTLVDYDVVVFDFSSRPLLPTSQSAFAALVGVANPDSIENFPNHRSIAGFLMNRNARTMVVIGSPLGYTADSGTLVDRASMLLPVFPKVSLVAGESFVNTNSPYKRYMKHVRGFTFTVNPRALHFGGNRFLLEACIEEVTGSRDPANVQMGYETDAYATTKSPDQLTAFRLHVILRSRLGPVEHHRTADWLPEPFNGEDPKVWHDLFADIGLTTSIEPPAWVATYETPLQSKMTRETLETRTRLERLQQELNDKAAALEHEARFRRLLYEDGDTLEVIVWEALHVLGAHVEKPKVKGHDDGRITTPNGGRGVLEIKGANGFTKLEHIRQLGQWMDDARDEDATIPWKGILIANAHRSSDPEHRDSPYIGAPCEHRIKTESVAVLTTAQIFEALCQEQRGDFDRDAFWSAVMNSVGIVDLKNTT